MSGFDSLSGYKPEQIDDNDFEVMTGKNIPVKVNYSRIEEVEAGEDYEGYERLKYELEVIDGKYKGRKLWKSYNLSSDKATGKEGKEKTPLQKLADVFFTLGLGEFSTKEQLEALNDKFASQEYLVSCRKIPAERSRDGKDVQLHTITAVKPENWEEKEESKSSTKKAF